MPIFEYRCRVCRTQFEKLQLGSTVPAHQGGQAGDKVVCKDCGSSDVERLVSAFAVFGASRVDVAESDPCGVCGAPRRGMCEE